MIDRVNHRVQTVVDKLVESLQESTMNNDVVAARGAEG